MTFEQFTYNVPNPSAIRAVILMDSDVPVEVLSSGDGSMHATYFESDKEKYDIELDGDTLYIRKKIRFMIGLHMFERYPDYVKLSMYLPEGYTGELSVATADGDIRVFGITASDLSVKATDGDIAVNRTHVQGNILCKSTDGDIAVGSITASEAALKTVDGDIVIDRPLIAGRLSCRTTDGDIEGTLAGRASDYSVSVRTVDGHSSIRSGGNGRTIFEARTTDGDIDVSFEDN